MFEFGKSVKSTHLKSKSIMELTNAAGSTEDEEAEPVVQIRAKRKTALSSKRLEKDSLDSKSKKKAKVIVEVIEYCFLQ